MDISSTKLPGALTPVDPIQITQLNIGTFTLDGLPNRGDVLAPLVSVDYEETATEKLLNIKIAVFIPTPVLGRAPLKLFLDSQTEPGEITLLLNFDSSVSEPQEYHAWYVCYKHVLDGDIEDVTSVKTVLENDGNRSGENPRTKRGTVTQVLQS